MTCADIEISEHKETPEAAAIRRAYSTLGFIVAWSNTSFAAGEVLPLGLFDERNPFNDALRPTRWRAIGRASATEIKEYLRLRGMGQFHPTIANPLFWKLEAID